MIPPSYIFKAVHQQRLLDADPDAERLLPVDAPPRDGLDRLIRALAATARAARGVAALRPTRA